MIGRSWKVLCDFDGTITMIDTAAYILDRFANGDWKGVEHMLESGELTIEESMKRQFEMISLSPSDMILELDKIVTVRPGFEALLRSCPGPQRLRVTSAGLDFYIRHFLEKNGWIDLADVVAPKVTDGAGGVVFEFPKRRHTAARNFKEDALLEERANGTRIAYIGDGTSDLWPALSADIAFAVKGSALDRLLDNAGREHFSFVQFQEVVERLERA